MTDDGPDRRFASTLARGLHILRAFRPTDNGLGNLEISVRTGIPRPTVSRLTFTLCQLGYLTHGRRQDKYRLGPAALALGNIAAASFAFVETASPLMQSLADKTGTLVGITIQDAGKMLMTKTWRPVGTQAVWLEVGYRMPVVGSSSGKAYLGSMNDAEFQTHLGRWGDDASEDILRRVRLGGRGQLLSKGYTFTQGRERYTEVVNAVAVPYRPSELAEPVSILCGAAIEILSIERLEGVVGPALSEAVANLRTRTGRTGCPLVAD